MKYVIAILALLCAAPIAEAQDTEGWSYINTSKDGTIIKARTADLHAGRSTMTAAKVWVQMDATHDVTVSWRKSMTLYAVNCTNQTYRVVSSTFYLPNGESVTDSRPYPPIEYIIPDSNMDLVASVLCYDPRPTDYR